MQLPPSLRQAIDRELDGIALSALANAAQILSKRYRAETRDGRLHLNDDMAARAYLTTRMPATFAAITAGLGAVIAAEPDFRPRTLLDVGAGPGTAAWAASSLWNSLESAQMIEASTAIRAIGERLSAALPLDRIEWQPQRIADGLQGAAISDLVVLAYVLDELDPSERPSLVARLWELAAQKLVIVEPGTTEGWKRILAARDQLIALGAQILAPCPHARACPLSPPDWCHFAVRVARSRAHREAKGGSAPWEDEKFIYLTASRQGARLQQSRVLAPPHRSKAGIAFKLCEPDGAATERDFAKRDRDTFKSVHKLDWGDLLPPMSR